MITLMDHTIKQLAIIGPTASGKSGLGVALAQKMNGIILSLDSLSIYKEIDIVSAKPTPSERGDIEHYGLDEVYPDEHFDVTLFAKLYTDAYHKAKELQKNLIIVGGTSFYLKSLIDGISPLPKIELSTKKRVDEALLDLDSAYGMLYSLDPEYMQQIKPNDTYRIGKALTIFFQTQQTPSNYFAQNPPTPTIVEDLPIYRITVEVSALRSRIVKRTAQMIQDGAIDEVASLEKKYTRRPKSLKAIGIKEIFAYLDGELDKEALLEKITTNTARLAKRQTTFNRSQFKSHTALDLESLEKRILEDMMIEVSE